MTSFIEDVLIDIEKRNLNISDLTFILPSKRAGNFLKNELSKRSNKTFFSPEIFSIEEFVETLSLIKSIPNTELLFELYGVYQKITSEELIDTFDRFCKWAQILIQDFNEIDRYLIPADKIFNYLSAIKELDEFHWSLEKDKTEFISNYLALWKKLPVYYKAFNEALISKGVGYQGLIYREALEKLELYMQFSEEKHHIFLGFNALNTAEEKIIQELLYQERADIYWDVDSFFVEKPYHDVGLFVREHKQWRYFENHAFKWQASNYQSKKNIHTIGVPKNIGQAKYVGELLLKLNLSNHNLTSTVVVLGDESLITPLLNSIPSEIDSVNISMGMPLHLIPLASLFDALFQLHKTPYKEKLYYKDVISIVSNPFIRPLLDDEADGITAAMLEYISKNNITYISVEKLMMLAPANTILMELLFGNWNNNWQIGLKHCQKIIQLIKANLDKTKKDNLLPLEYLFKFHQVFNNLDTLLSKYGYVKDLKSLYSLYKEILSTQTLDFQGEPLKGLQIIGMLESRVIDFETVIITSVNEGILPSGKSNNSFIPFDVKLQYGLPTYKDKDAVYAYHFYHLLQRAKNIYILYNTEVDALMGGEKSRFITQLEVEHLHELKHYFVVPDIPPIRRELKQIKKTDPLLKRLKEVALSGFSPSSLCAYIRNPIDFYYQKILNINTFEDVEETVASNTLGTIIHRTLETLYKPYVGQYLSIDINDKMKTKITEYVGIFFKEEFKDGDISSGKNLIIFEITKRYISNFLNQERGLLKAGNEIKLIALEKELKVSLTLPEVDFPVCLKGTIDRIDEYNGVLRIIDYKTGKVEQNKVEIVNWEDLTTDYDKYSKSFQILTYAYLMHLTVPFHDPVEAGIFSFKNLKSGFLKFAVKESSRSRVKDTAITDKTLEYYSSELKKLIQEICDPNTAIIEKEVR